MRATGLGVLELLWRVLWFSWLQLYVYSIIESFNISHSQHLIIDFAQIVEAFIVQVNNFPDGANGYYALLNNPLEVAKTVVYCTQTVMGDTVMVWIFAGLELQLTLSRFGASLSSITAVCLLPFLWPFFS